MPPERAKVEQRHPLENGWSPDVTGRGPHADGLTKLLRNTVREWFPEALDHIILPQDVNG
jgi:hypothetical protein